MAKRPTLRDVALILTIGIITFGQARAQSKMANSSWPAFRHDASMTASAPAHGPVLPEVKWKAEFGSGPLGSPVLASDGTIYVPGNADSALYAVAPEGKMKWISAGRDTEKFVAPLVIGQDGTIYFGSTTNIFYAVNSNGTERWRLTLGGAIRFSANIGSDGTIYVAANDCNLYAITPAGKIKWKVNLNRFPGNGPAIATDGVIYVVAGELLEAFNPETGALQPNFPVNCQGLGPLNGLMVEGKELIYVTALEKPRVWAISNSGALRWDYELPGGFGYPTLPAQGKDGTIYFGSTENGGIFALNHDGLSLRCKPFSWPGAKPLTELVVDDTNRAYIVNDKLGLIAIADCNLQWRLSEVRCAFSPAIGTDGTIYVASDRKLYAVGQKLSDITVLPNAIVFPQICVNTSNIDSSLIISNLGTAALEVTKLESSNPVFRVIPPTSFSVPPAGRHVVKVEFTPTAAAPHNGTLSIFGNDPDENPVTVPLSGSGGAADIAGAAEVDFGSVEVQTCSGDTSSSTRFYFIRNTGFCDLVVNLPDAIRVFVVSPHGQQIIKPGDSLKVELKFAPSVPGEFVEVLPITNNVSNKSPLLVALRGRGIAVPEIAITPHDTLDFGPVPVGSHKRLPITIKNLGALPLAVDSLVIKSKIFTTAPLRISLDCNATTNVDVAFVPPGRGIFRDALHIYSNDPDQKPAILYLRGQGAESDIDVMPNPLDFGTVCGGRDSVLILTVKNEGDDTLRVNALAFSNSAFSADHPTSFKVAPKNSEKIPVHFVAVAGKKDTCTLSIFSNDPDENPFKVGLRGEGVGPRIALETTPLDTGTVCLGATATAELCIVNPSDCAVLRVDSIKFTIISFNLAPFKTVGKSLFQAPPTPIIIQPKGRVCVTFDVENVTNDFALQVRVRSNAGNEDPAVRLVYWKVVLPVITGDEKVDFGKVLVGTSKPNTARIGNADGCDVIINSLEIKGGNTSAFAAGPIVSPDTLKAGATSSIPVIFAPKRGGQYTDTLLVFNNDPKRNPLRIAVTGIGEGDSTCTAEILVDPTKLEYGDVPRGSTVSQNLTISNPGCNTLHVTDMHNSQPTIFFVNAVDKKFDLAPGEKRLVAVFFAPAADTSYLDTLRIVNNDANNSTVLAPLHGRGVRGGVPDIDGVTQVNFGPVRVSCTGPDSSSRRTYMIRNVGTSALQIDSLTIAGDFLIISEGDRRTIAPNDSAGVVLQYAPKTPVAQVDTLKIFSNDPDESPLVVVLRGVGVAVPTLVVEPPDTLEFGDVPVSGTKRLMIKIMSRGAITLRVDSLVSSYPSIFTTTADEFALACGEDSSMTVAFSPAAPGPTKCTLSIYTNDPDKNPMVVTLLGNGVAGILTACERLDFGATCAGSPVTKECTLTNAHPSANVVIDSLRLASGKDFDFTFTAPVTLRPKETRTIKITFAPQKSGSARHVQDVLLISTKFSEQKYSITLLGRKRADGPDLALTPTLEFWGVLGRATECQPVWLRNEGCSTLVVNDLKLARHTNAFALCSVIPTPFKLEPGDSIAANVLFMPIDYGDFHDELRINNNQNSTAVKLTGHVPPGPICLEPDSTKIRFGQVFRNQSKSLTLGVTNCSNPAALLTVKALPLKLEDFVVMPDSLPNLTSTGSRGLFNITFTPKKPGERVDTLRLQVISVFDHQTQTVAVVVHGIGIDDEVYALPNAFTPNDDDKNDYAKIHFPGYKLVSPVLRIYDLRGIAVRVLHRTDNVADVITWDGRDESRRLQSPGAYMWLLEDQGKKVGSGLVVLIR